MTKTVQILTKGWNQEKKQLSISDYKNQDGYKALKKALKLTPEKIQEEVKLSGLRGRGGAGFPTGMKWGFLPPNDGKPKYLVINADESEPGTCKDIPLMLGNPHLLIEGIIISAYAIGCEHAFIFLRGEVVSVYRALLDAIDEAQKNGFLGNNILGSKFSLKITAHAGAGAYICGEETALLEALEGFRGHPRLKPPFPAIAGLYARPTIINNVETIASVPGIIQNGSKWFSSMGTEKSTGHGIFSLSGHVVKPGQYEAEFGITLEELLKLAGGIRKGHKLKFWTPGGSSTPMFTSEHLKVSLDHEATVQNGSMLGTRAIQIFDETTCVVNAVQKWMSFYAHESCGKCTPCREGTTWLNKILIRIENGHGKMEDLKTLERVSNSIIGKAFCPLGDGAPSALLSSLKYFKNEYIDHIKQGKCPFDHRLSFVFKTNAQRQKSQKQDKGGK